MFYVLIRPMALAANRIPPVIGRLVDARERTIHTVSARILCGDSDEGILTVTTSVRILETESFPLVRQLRAI